jgi:hypothetical protein
MYHFVILTLIISLVGCATRATTKAEEFAKHGQAPIVNLENYAPAQRRAGPQDAHLAVAVAISGGGHRAANFGAGVLAGLERIKLGDSNALLEVDYLSTVSGGGFAAGSYVTTLHDHLGGETTNEAYARFSYEQYLLANSPETSAATVDIRKAYCKSDKSHEKQEEAFCRKCDTSHNRPVCVRRNIERGYHYPVISSLTSPRVWLTDLDRGDYLEEKIDSKLLASCWRTDHRSLTLGDVFKQGETETPSLPYWVSNSTVYENGAIFPFTPDILKRYRVTGYTHGLEDYCIKEEIEKADQACKKKADQACKNKEMVGTVYDVPLAPGAKASASFPVAIPGTSLTSCYDDKNGFIHLFDGGPSDNLGTITALSLLDQDKVPAVGDHPRKLLIVIDAHRDGTEPFSSTSGSPTAGQITAKLTSEMPLSSRRGRYMSLTDRHMGAMRGVAIHLNFDTIAYADEDIKVEGCECYDNKSIVKAAKESNTEFNVTLDEQKKLFCAGLMAVKERENDIRDFFSGGSIDESL